MKTATASARNNFATARNIHGYGPVTTATAIPETYRGNPARGIVLATVVTLCCLFLAFVIGSALNLLKGGRS